MDCRGDSGMGYRSPISCCRLPTEPGPGVLSAPARMLSRHDDSGRRVRTDMGVALRVSDGATGKVTGSDVVCEGAGTWAAPPDPMLLRQDPAAEGAANRVRLDRLRSPPPWDRDATEATTVSSWASRDSDARPPGVSLMLASGWPEAGSDDRCVAGREGGAELAATLGSRPVAAE